MCRCGCGKCGDKSKPGTASSLSDDFGYSGYQQAQGYYLADFSADDIRRIAEEEARKAVTAANLAKIAAGDLTPITDVAVATTRRVCTTAVASEVTPYIPLALLAAAGILLFIRS